MLAWIVAAGSACRSGRRTLHDSRPQRVVEWAWRKHQRHARLRMTVSSVSTGPALVQASVEGMHVMDVLRARGLVEQFTGDGKELQELCTKPTTVYVGFDPTADSLHLGNLLAIIVLRWFQLCGHTPIALVGGATGKVGDPSGKSSERPVMSEETILHNAKCIQANIEQVLKPQEGLPNPIFVNNIDWIGKMSFLDFLRDVGKHARLGVMLAKDSVKSRLNVDNEGMSFTEFTYQLLQGYDFVHLSHEYGVRIQMGGSDQWGNITAGIDLAKKLAPESTLHAVTFPLLTKSDGKKFGKSEQGAVWLTASKLSPYEFYQHLLRTEDADVIKFLRRLTFLPMEQIDAVEQSMSQPEYVANDAQRLLAEQLTLLVHGVAGLRSALATTAIAAPGKAADLDAEALELASSDMRSYTCDRAQLVGQPVVDVLVSAELQKSRGEARRLLKNGGVYVNNARITDVDAVIEEAQLLDGRILLLAAGKKNKLVVRVHHTHATE
ncbi:Tyrosine--tRNA ligase [Porphyridium purpureum]|uniref:Tyrosine--tRNA ligase n=1 Tax=Porphyridium purpureum TaxID=35688 RepID=A0A5J4YKV2_PORPP|nr:Tyrosine--tRNA ligase [Porphyridium purpureum]|eukprot:POR9645..scf297_16